MKHRGLDIFLFRRARFSRGTRLIAGYVELVAEEKDEGKVLFAAEIALPREYTRNRLFVDYISNYRTSCVARSMYPRSYTRQIAGDRG